MSFTGMRRSDEEWARVIADYKQSGMSMRAYGEMHGINKNTLSKHTRGNLGRSGRRGARGRNINEWKGLFQEQIESGLSVDVWCIENGISASAMHSAKRRLRSAEGKAAQNWMRVELGEEIRAGIPAGGSARIRFHDVEIEADGSYPTEKIVDLIEGLRQR